MAELNWQDNSKEMFEKLIEGSPKPFRAMTEKKMKDGIEKKQARLETLPKIW